MTPDVRDHSPGSDPRAVARRDVERWFIAEGVPHFILDYGASHFVLTRAAPLLALYLVATTLLAMRFDSTLAANVLAVGVAIGVVLGGWAALNVARGRPWRTLPAHVGVPEVLAFLLLPAIPPIVLGLQLSDAITAVVESALFLLIVYVATSYGLLAITRWAFRRLVSQLDDLGRLLTRALPLLMVFIVFVFVQNDTWRMAQAMGTGGLVMVVVLFLVMAVLFMVGQLAPEIRRLAAGGSDWPDMLALAAETPAAPLCDEVRESTQKALPLRWHEWLNVGVVVVFGQGLQILLVTVATMLVLLLFGVLLFPVSLQSEWAGVPADVLASVTIVGRELSLTGTLLTVALTLGAFCGLYFTISALSDAAYRAEFFSEADRSLKRVFAVRAVYRTALDPAEAVGPPSPGA